MGSQNADFVNESVFANLKLRVLWHSFCVYKYRCFLHSRHLLFHRCNYIQIRWPIIKIHHKNYARFKHKDRKYLRLFYVTTPEGKTAFTEDEWMDVCKVSKRNTTKISKKRVLI
jgi:hypothetical protein